MRVAIAAAVAATLFLVASPASAQPRTPPRELVVEALCIHSGFHYSDRRSWPRERPDYFLFGHAYFRSSPSDDVLGGPGPNGEGGWTQVGSYGGGMSFTLGTYNRASDLLGLPRARSLSDIAREPPAGQIVRAIAIRQQDGHWGEWPSTSVSCGYR